MSRLNIPILVGSIREARQSLGVAELFLSEIGRNPAVDTNLLDLKDYQLPLLVEKPDDADLRPPALAEFTAKIRSATGLIIVAPEYKHGIPGALKNALDLLPPQALQRKPVAICTVSAGGFGGIYCLAQLRQVIMALGGLPIPDSLPISYVKKQLDPSDTVGLDRLKEKIRRFGDEFLWYARALTVEQSVCITPK